MKINFTLNTFIIIVLSIGFILIGIGVYTYPPREVRQKYVDDIIKIDGNNVTKILIEPYDSDVYSGTILKKYFCITNKEEIIKFCSLINSSKRFKANHPGTVWECVVTIWRDNKDIKFIINQTGSKGFYIYIYSDVTSGWFFGSYRSDELGKFINKLILRANKNN